MFNICQKYFRTISCSLTAKNRRALERVQKCAVRVILKGKYSNYEDGLKMLKIDTLDTRRNELCLRVAKNCLKNDKVKTMFERIHQNTE